MTRYHQDNFAPDNNSPTELWARAARARRMALKLIGDRAEKDLLALADELEAEAMRVDCESRRYEQAAD